MSGEEFYQLFKESMDRYAQELAQKPVAGWAEKSVAQMEAEGLMSRDAEGSLRPQSFATRQEVAVIAAGLLERGEE